jgi:putative phage-type endonuclease
MEYATARLLDSPKRKASQESSDSSNSADIPSAQPVPLPKEDRLLPSAFFDLYVKRTPEQCAQELSAPQRSQEWLDARKLCITASQFGAAIGDSPYQSPEDLVKEKLWNSFVGNAATKWGTAHEPHAKESFSSWFQEYLVANGGTKFKFIEENLMKFADESWMAVSPDGIVSYEKEGTTYVDLVEFKCPAYLRNTAGHPYSKHPLNVPSYYKAQMQGIMGYINTHHPSWKFGQAWFVVWQPHQTWITLMPYDEHYYADMHAKLKDWYFLKMLPAFAHKHNNLLSFGDSVPHEPISLDLT